MQMLTPPADLPSHTPEGAGEVASEGVVSAEARVARVRDRILETALPIVAAQHCELVSLEYRREPIGWVVRLFIEKLGHDPRKLRRVAVGRLLLGG